jgi:hypothetical protein
MSADDFACFQPAMREISTSAYTTAAIAASDWYSLRAPVYSDGLKMSLRKGIIQLLIECFCQFIFQDYLALIHSQTGCS